MSKVRSALYRAKYVAFVRQIFARRFVCAQQAACAETFYKYANMVRTCGPVHMIPQKTRVVFQVRMRFAGATPRKSHLLCHFILTRKIDNGRFHKIETFNPRCHAHYLRVNEEADLDAEVAPWLKEAYEVGEQKYLKRY
jgi:hypothetical protein